MKQVHVGSRVRIADTRTLVSALRGPAELRPEPGQMLWAGRSTTVAGYRRGTGGASLYDLKDAPGLWREAWLDAI
jgi:hypothetical protein